MGGQSIGHTLLDALTGGRFGRHDGVDEWGRRLMKRDGREMAEKGEGEGNSGDAFDR